MPNAGNLTPESKAFFQQMVQDFSGPQPARNAYGPGVLYADNDVIDPTTPRTVSDAGPGRATGGYQASNDPASLNYENAWDDGSMAALIKAQPLRSFDNTANVYTVQNLAAMPTWQIQGAGTEDLKQGMINLGGYRDEKSV